MKMNGYYLLPNESVLPKVMDLAKISHEEIKHPPKSHKILFLLGSGVGISSTIVYVAPTARLTSGKFYYIPAIIGTVGANAVLNAFFNNDGIKELLSLRDPIIESHPLIVPRSGLAFTGIVSLLSATCMAFLVFDKTKWPSYLDALAQLVNFTFQHYFGVMGLGKKISRSLHDSKHFYGQDEKMELLNSITKNQSQLIEQFHSDIKATNAFYDGDTLNLERLVKRISRQDRDFLITTPSRPSKITTIAYYLCQLFSLYAQVLGSIGYYNVNVNGFNSVCGSPYGWVLGTIGMVPFYLLAFIVSWDTIDAVVELIQRVQQNSWKALIEGRPYAVKKMPVTAALIQTSLTIMAVFSPFSALSVAQEAIYGGNEDSTPQFNMLAFSASETLQYFYLLLVGGSAIIFNGFPMPAVTDSICSTIYDWYCQCCGSTEEKQANEILKVTESVKQKLTRLPERHFVVDSNYPLRMSRPNRCHAIMNLLTCGFWNRITGNASANEASSLVLN